MTVLDFVRDLASQLMCLPLWWNFNMTQWLFFLLFLWQDGRRGVKGESWYDCDSVGHYSFLVCECIEAKWHTWQKELCLFVGLCSLLFTFTLGEEKTNKLVNSTGYKSSLTYSMILSPGGREGPGNRENLPTMPGTHVGERKGKSQHWGFHPASPNESFPLRFQIRLTIKRVDYSHPQSFWTNTCLFPIG